MKSYSSYVATRNSQTLQTEEVIGKNQVQNNAGGYVFSLTLEKQFERFLILGSEGGTYYVNERKLTIENAKNAIAFIKSNGKRAIEMILQVSESGRAPKNDPAIFALALACTYGNQEVKNLAYHAVPLVCRIGTHLFHFCQAIQDLRGWSRGLRKAVARFYEQKDAKDAAYQIIKYRQRDGWTHRDVLRLSHPNSRGSEQLNNVFRYAVDKEVSMAQLPQIIAAFEEAKTASVGQIINLIQKFGLSWEMIPTEKMSNKTIWEALIEKGLPMTAMIRNLGKMGSLGLLTGNNDNVKKIVSSLTDREQLKKARVHPLGALIALKVYSSGHGLKGDLAWVPAANIVDALDDAINSAFDLVEPTGKRYLLGLDVSGSMSSTFGNSPVECCEGTAVMALVTAKAEQDYHIMAFDQGIRELKITKKTSFLNAVKMTKDINGGGTDCALPMIYALQHKLPIDVFCVYTDNETWAGRIHPFEALKKYRKEMGINAKLVVTAMSATGFSIADPNDAGMLDVVGFDTSAPAIISSFAKA